MVVAVTKLTQTAQDPSKKRKKGKSHGRLTRRSWVGCPYRQLMQSAATESMLLLSKHCASACVSSRRRSAKRWRTIWRRTFSRGLIRCPVHRQFKLQPERGWICEGESRVIRLKCGLMSTQQTSVLPQCSLGFHTCQPICPICSCNCAELLPLAKKLLESLQPCLLCCRRSSSRVVAYGDLLGPRGASLS